MSDFDKNFQWVREPDKTYHSHVVFGKVLFTKNGVCNFFTYHLNISQIFLFANRFKLRKISSILYQYSTSIGYWDIQSNNNSTLSPVLSENRLICEVHLLANHFTPLYAVYIKYITYINFLLQQTYALVQGLPINNNSSN